MTNHQPSSTFLVDEKGRLFFLYLPNEAHKGAQRSVVPQVFEQIEANGVARRFKSYRADYPDGGQQRDFVWAGDCPDVMRWALEHVGGSGLFNLGTGEARSFDGLAQAVFVALDREVSVHYIDMPEGLQDRYQYYT